MGFFGLFNKDKQKVSKQEIKRIISEQQIEVARDSIIGSFRFELSLSDETIQAMLRDVDIKAARDSRIEAITAKMLSLMSRNGKDTKDIRVRFSEIPFNDTIKNILYSLEEKRKFQEIIWNDNYTIKDIKVKPTWKYNRDEYGWYYSYMGKKEYLDISKYIIAINEESEEYPMGRSELESLLKIYEIKTLTLEKMGNLINKYAETLKWAVYDRQQYLKDDGTNEVDANKIRESASAFKSMTDQNVVMVAAEDSKEVGINKTFGFITFDQFKTEVHMSIMRWCQEQIGKAYHGGTLTQDGGTTGSYALAKGHQELREEKAQSLCNYVQGVLQQLLYIDGELYGYDHREYYWKLEDEPDQKGIEELNVIKADKILKLSQAGYEVKTETIEKELGYQAGDIIKKEVSPAVTK